MVPNFFHIPKILSLPYFLTWQYLTKRIENMENFSVESTNYFDILMNSVRENPKISWALLKMYF